MPPTCTGYARGPRPIAADADLHALKDEAELWADFAIGRTPLASIAVFAKALEALLFSACEWSLGGFALPTKLVGVRAFQPHLAALREAGVPTGHPLHLVADTASDGVAVYSDDGPLGLVQGKHAWLHPLVGHGARAHLIGVTGDPAEGHTLGCNVALSGLGAAIDRL